MKYKSEQERDAEESGEPEAFDFDAFVIRKRAQLG